MRRVEVLRANRIVHELANLRGVEVADLAQVIVLPRRRCHCKEVKEAVDIGCHEAITRAEELADLEFRGLLVGRVERDLENALLPVRAIVVDDHGAVIGAACTKLVLLVEVKIVHTVVVLLHCVTLASLLVGRAVII